ncbi:alpha/beta hydrolase [Paenibacillus sp. ACRRX]|uniref:alpha/beta fold hydrolase n=1 Tax=Paenibacillus sp. ACRRX TaxID=2918206 RepID=UPI001EF458CD|nr:alpha/beta hydrolase [Paenibacillus sp. ACRRX]MCG7406861.1 alpha/beta hydrolase [Paenibacillus sp. ACRRX]
MIKAVKSLAALAMMWSFLALGTIAQAAPYNTSLASSKATSSEFHGKINLGAYSLYVNLMGETHEDVPSVVFDSGNGDDSTIWSQVAPQISTFTQTFTYDRVGLGQSDQAAGLDRSAKGSAERLHSLLHKAQVKGPYLLVSHSIAGLYAREFQALYPDEVAGIVFVDSSYENMEASLFPAPDFTDTDRRNIMEADLSNGTGVPIEGSYHDLLTSYQQVEAARAQDSLRNVPISVLTGGNHGYPPNFGNMEQRWANLQLNLASLSNFTTHHIDPDHGHYLHTQNPQLVIQHISDLIQLTTYTHN